MGSLEEFNNECLAVHNELRGLHNTIVLKLDPELMKAAQSWAENLASKETFQHSPAKDYGENIAMKMKFEKDFVMTGEMATLQWYSEIVDYPFGSGEPTNTSKIRHFSQVVWKSSTTAGFGRAKSAKSPKWYVVAQYKPKGNLMRTFEANVEAPIAGFESNQYIKKLPKIPQIDLKLLAPSAGASTSSTSRPAISTSGPVKKNPAISSIREMPEPNSKTNATKISIQSTSTNSKINTDKFYQFRADCINSHNKYRKKHGTPPLKQSQELEKQAIEWAQRMLADRQMAYSNVKYKGQNIGENVGIKLLNPHAITSRITAEELVDEWYAENKNHDYKKEYQNYNQNGHFTQMIWRSTEEIGAGAAEDETGNIYFAIFYWPPGNIKNACLKNVPSPK